MTSTKNRNKNKLPKSQPKV